MDYKIITFSAEDAESLGDIDKLCFSHPWSSKAFQDAAMNDSYDYRIAVSDDGTVLGYAGMITVLDSADVTNIAVIPSARRCGIGRALLCDMIASAKKKNIKYIHLEVRVSNEPAKSLYESLGFVTDGRRKNYYSKPTEDAVLMTLDVGGE